MTDLVPASTRPDAIQDGYNAFTSKRLDLNLTRGKPSSAQLNLSAPLLGLPGPDGYQAGDGTDCRNYGGLQGLPEARRLFAGLMGAPPDQVVVANNPRVHGSSTRPQRSDLSDKVGIAIHPWSAPAMFSA
jgi:hypothetical protein